ncbi:MAG: sulfite exporter TauE/SafE family protein [Chloroflexota bacterium]|nr:sulfite exporter TauE/SafE family protein [Chloroflexota bacterium]
MAFSGEFVTALLIILAAGAISGLAGFGFGLTSVPLLLLIYDPAAVVTVTKVLTLTTSWVLLIDQWRTIQARTLLGLLPWAIAGMVGGIAMLSLLDAAVIKLLASVVIIGFAALLLRRVPRPGGTRAHQPWATAVTGLSSGLLSTSTGLSGPPVVLLFTLRGAGMHAFRTSIAAYFMTVDVIGVPALLSQGIISLADITTAVAFVPAALIGRLAGMRLVRYVSPIAFRRVTLGLLLLTGAIGAIGATLALTG